jgi:ribokinase
MTRLAITGYASLDYPICLDGQIAGDRTTLISHRDPGAWPRIGGCPAYVAMAAVKRQCQTLAVSWIGSDGDGDTYLQGLSQVGVDVAGIARLDSERSPSAIMAYQGDGSCACLFDSVFAGDEKLTNIQRDIIQSASSLCITVGPPHLMEQILSCQSKGTRLYWILKNDTHCFTPSICKKLSRDADVIFCSQSERSLIAEVPPETIIVETRGDRGIRVEQMGQIKTLETKRIEVRDTTGAGDTFAGAYIGAEISENCNPYQAAESGVESVRQMLEQRLRKQNS